jgi:hypothetical protein
MPEQGGANYLDHAAYELENKQIMHCHPSALERDVRIDSYSSGSLLVRLTARTSL